MSETESIDSALAEAGGEFFALFSCAGVADGTPNIEKINFLGHRYMIDLLLENGALARGSAIGMISSAAGLGWENSLPEVLEYLDVTDFDEAAKWAQDHGKADYMFSKKAINGYVAREAFGLLKKGIRINAILPGPTDTPLAQANKEMWLGFGADYRAAVGIEASTPLEQAYALVFLCSDAAAAITGTTMITDSGYFSAGMTESFPGATPIVNFLLFR
jgi:NAD(P)-dependent dehydrogenase (short-subunit alcohol dehydrogenase family)